MRSFRVLIVALVAGASMAACQSFLDFGAEEPAVGVDASGTPGDATAAGDARIEGAADAGADVILVAPDSFALTVSPSHLTLEPGVLDTATVEVSLVRGALFKGAVDVTLQGNLGSALQVNPPNAALSLASGPTVTFTITATAKVDEDRIIDVVGVDRDDSARSAKTSFGVHLGTLFVAATSNQSPTLPPWVRMLDVKVWGAGGGGGATLTGTKDSPTSGGAGGGGGFVGARIEVDPSLPLELIVGTAGAAGTTGASGGGGGGYSAIRQGTTMLVVAGGGGGGGGAQSQSSGGYCLGLTPGLANGLGGGGAGGAPGMFNGDARSATEADAGTNPASGAGPGAAYQGGAAFSLNGFVAGGAPGGGNGGVGNNDCPTSGAGGGGGGGFYGGASGSGLLGYSGDHFSGGGGGSGHLERCVAGCDRRLAATGPTPPAATDPDYANNAGQGGIASVNAAQPGMPGLIVIRYVTP